MSVKVDSELLVDGEDGTETAFEVNVTGYETHTQTLQLLASDKEGVKNLTGNLRYHLPNVGRSMSNTF